MPDESEYSLTYLVNSSSKSLPWSKTFGSLFTLVNSDLREKCTSVHKVVISALLRALTKVKNTLCYFLAPSFMSSKTNLTHNLIKTSQKL